MDILGRCDNILPILLAGITLLEVEHAGMRHG